MKKTRKSVNFPSVTSCSSSPERSVRLEEEKNAKVDDEQPT
jgi:hypothetical protein